jgi:hypothetical protein
MRGRLPGSRNKKRKSDRESKDPKSRKRKHHQRKLEVAVGVHEFLTAEAKQAAAANPGGDASFLYQNTQAKGFGEKFGKQFDRVAKRLKRGRR